ncbi:tumor suppressor candidate 2-like [Hydractinia symbiolongicarpus]|uniref:tumor suppressor candidate 2-like n=1 Tax=Hydractinia symbiolongicarpus TaxID=13093 RepID=UPI00254D326F|nr:tumor suppressor candidate 2-like [Hydractinia symbiolongicarpus]
MGWLKSAVRGVKWFFGVDHHDTQQEKTVSASPFVTSKPSAMYIDEDGDLAEEFYEEVILNTGRPWMRRITEHLTWQGMVQLEFPRLHVDFPVVLYDT